MPTATLPGTNSPATTSYVSPGGTFYIYSTFTTPVGRAMANGSRNTYTQSLNLYVAGRGSTRSVRALLAGTARGSWFSAGAQTTPTQKSLSVGVQTVSGSSGMSYGIYWNGGAINFRRGGGGSTKSSGSSSWGSSLSGTITYAEAPPAPTPIGVDQATPTSLRVRFSSNGDGGANVTGWVLQYSTSNTFPANARWSVNSGGTSTLSGLTPDTTYYFRAGGKNIVTDNAGTNGPWSTVFSGKTLASTPGPPRNVKITQPSQVTVKLTWDAPSSDGGSAITLYEIHRTTDSGTGIVAEVGPTERSWTSGPLDVGTSKFFLTAVNANGRGTKSAEVSMDITRTGYPKVEIQGSFIGKPVKVYLGGVWVTKPMKVFKGGQWVTLL